MYTFTDTILKVEDVSLKIDDKLILRDINLEIKDIIVPGRTTGQIIFLGGPSGKGKTQLLKLLSGLKKPTTGRILLGDGHEVKAGDVGVVAQNYPLFEHRTVLDNLQMVVRLPKAEAIDKINFYLERFKMTEHKDKYPAVLSGGQRQRVAIMQQMLCSDYFIILDEPFSGLDPLMTTQVCEMIQEVADINDKNTIIIISHDIPAAVSISNIMWLLGNDYDDKGVALPGARIKFVENLMDKGLCWRTDITSTPEFFEFVKDVRNVFNQL